MRTTLQRQASLLRDGRGFTKLEFSLLTAMLCAMVINGIATLGGGLGSGSKPIGAAVAAEEVKSAGDQMPIAATIGRR